MKIELSHGAQQQGVVFGNTYPKYSSKNPLVKWLMKNFESHIEDLLKQISPESIHEVGCGEGFWVLHWRKKGFKIRGSDFSSLVIDIAKKNAEQMGADPNLFSVRSIEELNPKEDSAECILCLEVLEHLEEPEFALEKLKSLEARLYVFSVPQEPVWRILNVLRGKYLTSFGNTPGHLQHWSRGQFVKFISEHFRVEKTGGPFPWTVVLCSPKSQI
jgi:2-polyprenyl-3-methyl-5-hydroxy-6-metoxy-1,4-benzoquinol methylase